MQTFIANGRVAAIADDALGRTNKGTTTFKFNFVCDSSQQGDDGRPLPTFFPIQLYGSQADFMSRSLSIGSPILVKGEIIQRPYTDKHGQRRTYTYIAPSPYDGITFLEDKAASDRRRQSQSTPQMANTGAVPQDPIAQEVTYAETTGQATSQPETFPAGNYEPLDAGDPFA